MRRQKPIQIMNTPTGTKATIGLEETPGIIFREEPNMFIIINTRVYNGNTPDGFEWKQYGDYSWQIHNEEYAEKCNLRVLKGE